NFLRNKAKINDFINALELKKGELVIEIGPGKGVITKDLLKKEIKLICIEKDEKLVKKLSDKFKDEKLEIIEGDALEIIPKITKEISPKPYKLVGNIPYYITGKLFRTIEELTHKPTLSVLGIQKQVAQRVTANPPKMNILSASVQFWGEPEIISFIPKSDFDPSPKVDGGIVKIKTKDNIQDSELYFKAVKIIFKHPRKTLANNLSIEGLDKEKIKNLLESSGIIPSWRPENLSIRDIKKISKLIEKMKLIRHVV
ncbi:MAG: 16S rRNA (adenine(1518)-N(6)/adenine(1519)-N(6))-dimethyltransferase RsmA, partial [Candidatus Paceibacterota bacterium]